MSIRYVVSTATRSKEFSTNGSSREAEEVAAPNRRYRSEEDQEVEGEDQVEAEDVEVVVAVDRWEEEVDKQMYTVERMKGNYIL